MKTFLPVTLAAAFAATIFPAQAQTLTDTWSFAGGGLAPASYTAPGFQPSPLVPDATADQGARIFITGLTSGGLGSSGFPTGYGGYYTFRSTNVNFDLQGGTILSGTQQISLTVVGLWGSVGMTVISPTASSVLLDYNPANLDLVGAFASAFIGNVSTPIGPLPITRYTWTWDVSALGTTTDFDLSWITSSPNWFSNEINLVQAVPEPSVFGLVALGGLSLLCGRRRKAAGPVSK